jgi:DNA (cytosine-5)-methyltransferase 1
MTQFESWPDDQQHAIDLLCGGTPCQSFSVAGLRKGLDDARGNLMLTFAAIAAKYRPKWLVWENVPGVLSSNSGRDFASFLGLLSGQVIEPPKEGWGNSGIITGYENAYSLAYRVLDAQYFGVAQRRKRVFVVGCLGANRSAAAVLFERYSLSGNPAPSRSKGQSIAGAITAGAFTGGAGGRPEGAAANHFIPTIIDRAAFNQGTNALYEPLIEESETMPTIVARGPHAVGTLCIATGQAGAEIGADMAPTLNCNHEAPYVAYGIPGNWIGRAPENGGNAVEPMHDVAPCQTKTDVHAVAYAFDSLSSNSMKSNNPESGCNLVDVAKTIDTSGLNPACNQGGNAILQPVHREKKLLNIMAAWPDHAGCAPIPINTQMALRGATTSNTSREGVGVGGEGDPAFTLQAAHSHAVCAPTLTSNGDAHSGFRDEHGLIAQQMQVRRLTPTECERLQGFPDGYTNVPHRGKPAADGNRYKALGNSWAVPVAAWIGKRIEEVTSLQAERLGATPC